MAKNSLAFDRLRHLAELRPEQGRVLSVFFNLDPAQFPLPAARSTELNSVMTSAARHLDDAGDLSHPDREALKADLARVRGELGRTDLATNGTRGLAVYACSSIDLLEVVRLNQPVDSRAVINDRPFIEPLIRASIAERWFAVLLNSRSARIFVGGTQHFHEIESVEDDVHKRHEQGGWSQANFQRSVDKEKLDHLDHVASVLFEHFKRNPFDRLVIGTPSELTSEFEGRLHPYLRERIAGHIQVDVNNVGIEEVRDAASAVIESTGRDQESAALKRLTDAIHTGGRGVAGLEEVLAALNESRVEALLIAASAAFSGRYDPKSGFLAPQNGVATSPDGNQLVDCDDIVELSIQRALEQSAEIMVIHHQVDELNKLDGVGALLRF